MKKGFSSNTLYLTAAALWIIAGINILKIGIESWLLTNNNIWDFVWLIISLIFFYFIIFPRTVKRNISYVQSHDNDKLPLYKCMHPQSWIIMIFMISLGVVIRGYELVPKPFIAGFYCGLGFSLATITYLYFRAFAQNK